MRSSFSSRLQCGLRNLGLRLRVSSLAGVPSRWWLCQRYCLECKSTFRPPLYLIKSDEDVSSGLSVVEAALKVLEANSPLWMARMRRSFARIMIVDFIKGAQFVRSDRCCLVNPWYVLRNSDSPASASLMLATLMLGRTCEALLGEGRFGYFGLQHLSALCLRAEFGFLRRLLPNEPDAEVQVSILALMSLYAKHRDGLYPGRPGLYASYERELQQVGEARC